MSDSFQKIPDSLVQKIAAENKRSVQPAFQLFTAALKQRFGETLDAIMLYGSCLHTVELTEGIADFYVLVNDYRRINSSRMLAVLNAWLPPNVYYLEVPSPSGVIRAKYAVISTEDFEHGACRWFHPYIWARFAQPARLLYVRDQLIHDRVHNAQACAVLKFINAALPVCQPGISNFEAIWSAGLQLTYAAELRAESKMRAHHLVELNLDFYRQLTVSAEPALVPKLQLQPGGQFYVGPTGAMKRAWTRCAWFLRRWQGRVLSILRLSKATLTFRDCLNYAAWKIERHTGVKVEITPMLRRHPILWGYKVMWQLLRRGVLR